MSSNLQIEILRRNLIDGTEVISINDLITGISLIHTRVAKPNMPEKLHLIHTKQLGANVQFLWK